MKHGLAHCESPVETMLGEALCLVIDKFNPAGLDDDPCEVGRWPGWFMALLSQPQIDNLRPDFAICPVCPDGSLPWMLLIEVDGHDFHEKTKVQARRDKSRDRRLTGMGGSILRFTGSEVWHDAEGCAYECVQLAVEKQRAHLDREFTIWLQNSAIEKAKAVG